MKDSSLSGSPFRLVGSSGSLPGLTLFLCGDVMTGRGIDQILPQAVDPRIYESYVKDAREYVALAEKRNGVFPKPVDYAYIWGDALQVWQQVKPALKLINLETSITLQDTPWPEKEVLYRMHPANVQVFTAAGIDFCSLANNHTLDWGHQGLLETMQCLQSARIPFAGAGENGQNAARPALLQVPQGRVVILACGAVTSGVPYAWAAQACRPGINLLPDFRAGTVEKIAGQVQAIRQPGDVILFSLHWGSNWGYELPSWQQDFARQLIDQAGVDLVWGHSSHHPRGIEIYHHKLIIYGAGDFMNDYEGISGYAEFRADLTLMYFPRLDPATGNLLSLLMVPMQLQKLQLHYAAAQDAAWLTAVLDRESRELGARVKMEARGDVYVLQGSPLEDAEQ